MLRNCKGFSLAESLAALSMWTFILLMLVPAALSLYIERGNTLLTHHAAALLHEYNYKNYFEKETGLAVYQWEGREFHAVYKENNNIKETCIYWVDYRSKTREKCLHVQ
ncbi:hypothetical protein [Metabacillus lacus]|uniref:hypothetical protein n=1 Tax=Metabacillus lacus TaxID=1983721 RepID=UPI0014793F7B|nr:hypothetical protein [Metabacillus lacus]